MRARHLLANSYLILAVLFFAGLAFTGAPRAWAQENSTAGSVSAEKAEASKGAGEAEGEDEQAQFKQSGSVKLVAKYTGLSLKNAYWLCVLINFAIIAGAIGYFGKKSLPGFFKNRTASIQQAMREAQKASEDANRRLNEIETRLSRLDTDIATMRATAEKDAIAEAARIKAAAEEDGRKIVESAEQEIAAAAKLARRELTSFAANLAVSLAAKQIKVDAPTDQALVRGFAQELSAETPGGGKSTTGRDGH